MFNSLKSKMIIPIVGVLALLMVAVVVYVSGAMREFGSGLSQERMVGASGAARAYLNLLEQYNLMATRAMVGDLELIAGVRDWNAGADRDAGRQALLAHLGDKKGNLDMTAVVITDAAGYVILRTHDFDSYGDSVIDLPAIADALSTGATSVTYTSTAAMRMGLSGVAPIRDGEQIIGAAVAMVNMDTLEFVDSFSAVFNANVTVFSGTESVASTIVLPSGVRSVGSHVAPHVAEVVLGRGEVMYLDLMILGILPHRAYYFPLFGWDGTPIGIFFVGFSTQQLIATAAEMQRNLVIIAVVGVLAAVAIMLLVILRLLKPLDILTGTLNNIANGDGDLTVRLAETSKDEIARASRYFNQTIGKIRDMVVAIKTQAVSLADIGNDLASNMTHTASAMNNIASNLQGTKSRVDSQGASVTQTNLTMEQVTANIGKLSSHVERQSSAVSDSSAAIEEMLANIQSVTSTIARNAANVNNLKESANEGRSSLQDVADDIQGIARESEGLLEINAVMENIASQTNLLSMNAAIEAAHAGEAGKGFAVVADEIRKLAESSGEQSKTIGDVLKRIKESVDKILRSTGKVMDQFETINSGIRVVADQEEVIRNAMDEQNQGSKQVLQAASLVNEITQQVKDDSAEMAEGTEGIMQETKNLERATREITSGINEMAASATEVNMAVNMVNDLSGRNRENISCLVKVVSQFKV